MQLNLAKARADAARAEAEAAAAQVQAEEARLARLEEPWYTWVWTKVMAGVAALVAALYHLVRFWVWWRLRQQEWRLRQQELEMNNL